MSLLGRYLIVDGCAREKGEPHRYNYRYSYNSFSDIVRDNLYYFSPNTILCGNIINAHTSNISGYNGNMRYASYLDEPSYREAYISRRFADEKNISVGGKHIVVRMIPVVEDAAYRHIKYGCS